MERSDACSELGRIGHPPFRWKVGEEVVAHAPCACGLLGKSKIFQFGRVFWRLFPWTRSAFGTPRFPSWNRVVISGGGLFAASLFC
ncbi:hypothetical protein U1Q18_032784 [Sarracenia purpurea var. burkii]